MQVLFLPGFSHYNIEEAQEIKNHFEQKGHQMKIHPWIHWVNKKEKGFSVENEIKSIKKEIEVLNGDFGIISKSVGTWVAINLIRELDLKPEFLILMGIPLPSYQDRSDFYNYIITIAAYPIYIIQNKFDPVCSSENLKTKLSLNNVNLIEVNSKTHSYVYPEMLLKLINQND